MSYSWGYKEGARHAKEIGLTPSKTTTKVTVKGHTRAPRTAKAPPVPTSPSLDTPKLAKGGKVKHKATGGGVKLSKKKGC